MPINRNLWKQSMSTSYAPRWPCPSCREGTLKLDRDSMRYEETARSRRLHNTVDWHIMDCSFAFTARLICERCSENISCVGVGGHEQIDFYDEDGTISFDYDIYLSPRYFVPSMKLFRMPNRSPEEVRNQLYKSFSVFFCDLGAAANHIRQCVEEVLAHAGIPARGSNGKYIALSTRIKQFASADPENAGRASALRWIGNFGSHPESLTRDDLFDAYEILEVLLEDLYIGHQRSIRQIVRQINTARRPRG